MREFTLPEKTGLPRYWRIIARPKSLLVVTSKVVARHLESQDASTGAKAIPFGEAPVVEKKQLALHTESIHASLEDQLAF